MNQQHPKQDRNTTQPLKKISLEDMKRVRGGFFVFVKSKPTRC